MRINEYKDLNEFTLQYCGFWNPSEGKWLGLEFEYKGKIYRFQTGPMFEKEKPVLPNGKQGEFCVYEMVCKKESYPFCDRYELIGWYSDMDDVLENCVIDGEKFKNVIQDDNTRILAQD